MVGAAGGRHGRVFPLLRLLGLLLLASGAAAWLNPLALGADPHVTLIGGHYHVLSTRGIDIAIYVVASLDDLDAAEPVR